MTDAELLVMLAQNLEISTTYMDEEAKASKAAELTRYTQAAERYITAEGIALDRGDVGDCQLVVMYAAWLYEKRKTSDATMPRMLRWNLNNRLFRQKMRGS